MAVKAFFLSSSEVILSTYQLNTNASIIHFDSELERFADETFLETALPLKENIPVKAFFLSSSEVILSTYGSLFFYTSSSHVPTHYG